MLPAGVGSWSRVVGAVSPLLLGGVSPQGLSGAHQRAG